MNQKSTLTELDQLKRAIMRRVYVLWFFRTVAQSVLIKLSILIFLLGGMIIFESPGAVWHNAQISGGLTNYRFFVSALINTEAITQLAFLAIIAISFWLTKSFWLRLWRFNLANLTGFFSRVRF